MPDPVQTALMIPAVKEMADDFIATIDSIREQSHVPWVVYVMDFGGWTEERFGAREALNNLQLFCPRVHVIRFRRDHDLEKAYMDVKNWIFNAYSIPVLVVVNNTPIDRRALWEVSYPFLNPQVDIVHGRYEDMRVNKGWFGRLWYRMTRRARTDLVAYRNYNYKGER